MEKLIHSGSLESSPSAREIRHGELARKLAAEGMVLLKNNGLLPLPASAPVAVFGCGAVKTVKGGIGSGDVNNRESISIVRGLREAGMTIISTDWLKDAEQRYTHARSVWKEKILPDNPYYRAAAFECWQPCVCRRNPGGSACDCEMGRRRRI